MLLYHYTNLNALMGILQKDALHFHGSRYDCMNDPLDYLYAKENVLPILEREYPHNFEDMIETIPYIVSFSKSFSMDSVMLSLYSAQAILVLESDCFPNEQWEYEEELKMKVFHGDVYYSNNDRLADTAVKLYRNAEWESQNYIDDFTLYAFPFIKHFSYMHEDEYRLVGVGYKSHEVSYDQTSPDRCIISPTQIDEESVQLKDIREGKHRYFRDFPLPKKSLITIVLNISDAKVFNIHKNQLLRWAYSCGYDIKVMSMDEFFNKE